MTGKNQMPHPSSSKAEIRCQADPGKCTNQQRVDMELLPVITPPLSFSHAGSSLIHLDPSSSLPLALPLNNQAKLLHAPTVLFKHLCFLPL